MWGEIRQRWLWIAIYSLMRMALLLLQIFGKLSMMHRSVSCKHMYRCVLMARFNLGCISVWLSKVRSCYQWGSVEWIRKVNIINRCQGYQGVSMCFHTCRGIMEHPPILVISFGVKNYGGGMKRWRLICISFLPNHTWPGHVEEIENLQACSGGKVWL